LASDLEREKAAERTRQYHRAMRAATPEECSSSETVAR
jgi:predicted HAD superfamily Cof-like phosphohydrolase